MATPPAPKLDFKMLIVPAVLFFGKKIDFKDPQIAQLVTGGFATVVAVVLAVNFYLYTCATAKKESKNIWVPPKPKPTLPFGLGPAPEPITAADFTATTYQGYEVSLIKENVQSVLMSGGISFLMSMKFGPMSLLIQAIMIPINLSENVVFKKYVLGVKTNAEGGALYNELFTAPTPAIVAALNAANAPAADSSEGATSSRVEELPDEKEDKKNSKKDKKDSKKKETTSAEDID